MKLKILIAAAALALLGGCAEPMPISSGPPGLAPDSTLATGLKNAAYNLDQAVAIGVLPKDDPAVSCVHGVLKDAGLEADAAPAQSFTPRVTDLISAGAVAYIDIQRLKALRGTVNAPPVGCEALIGQITIDGLRSAGRALPFSLVVPLR